MSKRNRTHQVVTATAYGMFALGLGLSVTHTVDFFHDTLGAAMVSSIAAPVFIDGIQVIGKLGRGAQFAQGTRRMGFRVQMIGALLSLIANVVAGPTVGDKVLGVVFVGGYMFAEWYAEALRPASDDTAAATAAKRAAAAAKAAATRKATADAAVARKADAAERRRIAREIREAEKMAETFDRTVAPVSPAVGALPTTYL